MRGGLLSDTSRSAVRLTRREALRGLGLTGLGVALLSACWPQARDPAADSKPAAPGAASQSGPASKPAAVAQTAPGAPKEGGTFRVFLHTENAPTLDPYLNISFRTQEFSAFFYSRLIMPKKAPGLPG